MTSRTWKPWMSGMVLGAMLSVTLLAGCSDRAKDGKTPIKSAKPDSAKPAAPKPAPEEDGKLSGDAIDTPTQYTDLLNALAEGDKMFMQFWKLYFQERQDLTSPFKDLHHRLSAHKKGAQVLADRCAKNYHSVIKLERDTDKNGKPANLRTLKYEIAASSCSAATTKAAEVTFTPKQDGTDVQIVFQRSVLSSGFGLSLATLGGEANCLAKIGMNHKLSSLKCSGLGQNKTMDLHLRLTNFEFLPSANLLLNVQGSKFNDRMEETCVSDDKGPCINFTCDASNPKCVLDENMISKADLERRDREERARDVTPIAPPPAPTATPAQTPGGQDRRQVEDPNTTPGQLRTGQQTRPQQYDRVQERMGLAPAPGAEADLQPPEIMNPDAKPAPQFQKPTAGRARGTVAPPTVDGRQAAPTAEQQQEAADAQAQMPGQAIDGEPVTPAYDQQGNPLGGMNQ